MDQVVDWARIKLSQWNQIMFLKAGCSFMEGWKPKKEYKAFLTILIFVCKFFTKLARKT